MLYFPKIQIETSGTEVEIEVSMGGIFAMIYRKESTYYITYNGGCNLQFFVDIAIYREKSQVTLA